MGYFIFFLMKVKIWVFFPMIFQDKQMLKFHFSFDAVHHEGIRAKFYSSCKNMKGYNHPTALNFFHPSDASYTAKNSAHAFLKDIL